jgi:hypothetical protein
MKKLFVFGVLCILVLIAAACVTAEGPAGSTPTEELALVGLDTSTPAPSPTETAAPDTPTAEPPIQLVEVGALEDIGSVVDVHLAGDYAYLADSFGGLRVVDVSDPTQPVQVSAFESPGSTRGQGVFVVEPYLYLADGQGVRVLDIADLTAPEVVGFYDTLGFALDLQIIDDLAYVAAREGGLYIGDFTDPTDPRHVSQLFDAGTDHVLDVQVSGDYAYVAMQGQGLKIVDVSQPDKPVIVGNLDTDGMAEAVVVDGGLVYLADGEVGIKVLDVSDPTAPTEVGRFDTPGYAQDLVLLDGYLYVADGPSRSLLVLDLNDPTNPLLMTEYETTGFVWGVTLSGSDAFLALGEQGLSIVSVEVN